MRDFPPEITTFYSAAGQTPGPAPDTRTPAAFLRWFMRYQWRVIALSTVFAILWQMPLTVGPLLFGKAIDDGVTAHSPSGTLFWAGLLFLVTLVGATFGILLHTLVVRSWLIGLYGTMKMVTRKVVQMGHVLPRRTPTGEVLSVASSDSDEFGALTEIISRAASQVVAYLVVAFIVLSISPTLGILILLAAPVLVTAAMPLLKPLHRRQQIERSRNSDLTSMATDIVAGLRILRGIGGERTFGRNYDTQSQLARQAGVSAGIWQAAIEAVGVLFSGVFIVLLVWLGTHEVVDGDLTIGQLISFLGYALFMIYPIQTFFELAQKVTRAMVSARKAIAIFEHQPPWPDLETSTPLPDDADLYDELSGFTAHDGELTIVVSAIPEDTAALADRLGRYLPADTEPVSQELEEGLKGRAARRARAQRLAERARLTALDEELANREWGVRLGGVDLGAASLDDVRRHILVSDTGSQLFAGTLQDAIDPHGRLTREQAEHAVRVANAEDVYDALPGGWQGMLDERGRGLSGGQRQRVVLARALAVDAPDPGAGRADVRRRRAHRGADRRAGRRRAPWPDDRGDDRLAAVAAPRRPGRAVRERQGRRSTAPTRSCSPTARRTAASSRGPWTHRWRRCRAMSTLVSDPLATSAETWRDHGLGRPRRSRPS